MTQAPEALRRSFDRVRERIAAACARAGRDPAEVRVVAVTKGVPLERVAEARAGGLEDLGESYAAELAEKAAQVDAVWHYVGRLQRGTARHVALHASIVHSAAPGSGFDALVARARRLGRTLPCLVQVDLTNRLAGVAPADAEGFVAAADTAATPVVGLMTIAPLATDPEVARRCFRELRVLRDRLRTRFPSLTGLSMGMSADLGIAVEEGATMVRVGTALFGPRPRAAGGDGAVAP